MKKNSRVENWQIIFLAAFSLAILLFLMISASENNFITNFDAVISLKISEINSTPMAKFFTILTTTIFSAEFLSLLVVLMSGYLFYKKRKSKSLFFVGSLALALILKEAINIIVKRARPPFYLLEVAGYSFPSGHTLTATIFFILLSIFFKDKIKSKFGRMLFFLSAAILALLAGFARIYLNLHWLSDVIAGIFLGIFAVCICQMMFKIFTKVNNLPVKK